MGATGKRTGWADRYDVEFDAAVAAVSTGRLGPRKEMHRIGQRDTPFELAPGLTAPGAISLDAAEALVIKEWGSRFGSNLVSAVAYDRMTGLLARWFTFCRHFDCHEVRDQSEELALAFVETRLGAPGSGYRGKSRLGEAPSVGTMHVRRSTLRAYCRTLRVLGLDDRDLTLNIDLPRREDRRLHSVTDEQVQRLKDLARYNPQQTLIPAAVALTFATCCTSEAAAVTVKDVHLAERRVRIEGEGRRLRPRWGVLDDWSAEALERRIAYLRDRDGDTADDTPLAYNGTGTRYDRKQSALATTLARGWTAAGITPNPSPLALLDWVATRIFAETGRIEAVAARMGFYSLDAAAHLIRYDWLPPYRQTGPDGQA